MLHGFSEKFEIQGLTVQLRCRKHDQACASG